jgi:uncharacterized membrane protein YqiK
MQSLIQIGAPVIAGLVIIALALLFLSRLYRRSSKEMAFVRTGMGGQKVIKDGGALVFPVLHETTPVNMTTLRLQVQRQGKLALITKDSMRVDVTAEFYVRVMPNEEAIADAAQTLGTKTMEPEHLKGLIEGKFVDALRSVAATSEMQELHEKRTEFVQKVREAVASDIKKNGLELESVSLTGLDQTNKEALDPNNAFDAEGLAKLAQITESRKKLVNDTEQENRVLIAQKNLETTQRTIAIKRDEEYAQIENERDVANRRAEAKTAAALVESQRNREAQEAHLDAQRHIDTQRLATEQNEATKKIEKEKAIELAEQDRQIAIAERSRDESRARTDAEVARAEAVQAEEQVETARATEIAKRAKSIEIIRAEEQAERAAIGVTVQARAEREAAENRAAAVTVEAQAEAGAEKIKAEGTAARYEAEAEGQRKLNEAANSLSEGVMHMRIREAAINILPHLAKELVEPMRHIDSIKLVGVNGGGNFGLGGEGAAGGASNGHGSLADDFVDAGLRQTGMKALLGEVLDGAGMNRDISVEGLTRTVSDVINPKPAAADTAARGGGAPHQGGGNGNSRGRTSTLAAEDAGQ